MVNCFEWSQNHVCSLILRYLLQASQYFWSSSWKGLFTYWPANQNWWYWIGDIFIKVAFTRLSEYVCIFLQSSVPIPYMFIVIREQSVFLGKKWFPNFMMVDRYWCFLQADIVFAKCQSLFGYLVIRCWWVCVYRWLAHSDSFEHIEFAWAWLKKPKELLNFEKLVMRKYKILIWLLNYIIKSHSFERIEFAGMVGKKTKEFLISLKNWWFASIKFSSDF